MLPAAVRLVGVSVVVALAATAGAAQPDDDPVYEGKKASEWVSTLQNDASARKRALAVVALGKIWDKHQYKDALPNIGRSLRVDTSAAVRVEAATVLGNLKPVDAPKVDSDLVDALKGEKESRVRKEIATAVGRFPDVAKKSVAPLTAVLKDPDPATRAAAADALAKAGAEAKTAAPELLPLLGDSDKAVRTAAVFALGRIAPDNPGYVAAALVKLLGDEKDAELRREVIVSLGLLGDKSEQVVTALSGCLADPDPETVAVAVRTLGTFGTAARPAAPALLKLATEGKDKGLRIDAVRAFGSAHGPALKDHLKDLIPLMEKDPDFEVRLVIVEEIGALGNTIKDDKEAMAALRRRLSDPQVKVREGAAVAIRRIEKPPEKKPADKPPDKKP